MDDPARNSHRMIAAGIDVTRADGALVAGFTGTVYILDRPVQAGPQEAGPQQA